MNRFTSDPIANPAHTGQPAFERADLVFYGVDHSGPSYEARIYLNNIEAGLHTPRDPDAGFAGSFTVFGHGGCFGDSGHCDPSSRPADPFDVRPPHPLTPQTKTVIVTDGIRLIKDTTLTVTVVPIRPGTHGAELVDAMQFASMCLLTYN